MSWRRFAGAAVCVASLGACASAGAVRPTPLPHRFLIPVGVDSARSLAGEALTQEQLPIDGSRGAGSGQLTSTFLVRRGGMGEAEVRLTLRLSTDTPSDPPEGGVILDLDATIRDLRRMVLMSPEDARSPRMTREPHPVQDNDRETLGRIRKLEDRLQQLGFVRAGVR